MVKSQAQDRTHKHNPRVWKTYRPPIIFQGREIHRFFIRTEEGHNAQPSDDRTPTNIENLNTTTINFTGTGHHIEESPHLPIDNT